jgi:phosphonate transport system substrate-binding protein
LTPLAVSEQLLHLPWAVKRTMSAQLRETVRSSLVDLENSEAGRNVLKAALLTGIGKAEDKDYEPHRKMVRAVMGAAATQ